MRIGPQLRRERGASLLIALIFLVIMAMLGVTVANVTTMQERMAGHTRDRDLALQAAEAALRDAEAKLQDAAFRSSTTAIVDYDPTLGNDSAFWEKCFEDKTSPCLVATQHEPERALPEAGSPGALAGQPKYVVERKPVDGTTEIFRVTARAVGGSEDAVVILQAEFGIAAAAPPTP
jgi:type IV pilus assembly protein PilX